MKKLFLFISLFVFAVSGALLGAPSANAATGYDDLLLEHDPETPTVLHYYSNYWSVPDNGALGERLGSYSESDFYGANYGFCGSTDQQQNSPAIAYSAIQRIADGYPYIVYVNQDSTTSFETPTLKLLVSKTLGSNFTVSNYDYGTVGQHYLTLSNPDYDSFVLTPRGSDSSTSALAICEWPTESSNSIETNFAHKYTGYINYAKVIEVNRPLLFEEAYSGYEPQPPSSLQNSIPAFGWTLSNNKLDITHWKHNTDLPYSAVNAGYGWRINLYQTGSDYDIETLGEDALIDSQLTSLQGIYSYSDLPVGYYVATINLSVTPPAALRPDIKQVTFKIQNIGQFVSGSTEVSECEEGVCEAPPVYSLASCFQEEFPFVDVDSCSADAKSLIYLLTFKTVTFGERPTVGDCTTLTVLDGWLHIEDSVVCAQFPDTIRNIITPFVTFLLGLVMMKFLTRKEGYIT